MQVSDFLYPPGHNDSAIEGSTIRPETVPSYLPKELTEAILASDVTILLASSETKDQAMTVRYVYATGLAQPEYVASHAYAKAVQDSHQDLLRMVRGEPTDAQRYRAFRDFSNMESTDPERYQQIDAMLVRFEEENPDDDKNGSAEYSDKVADFLVHALFETTPLVVEQKPDPAPN
jgi:hypothetical protein